MTSTSLDQRVQALRRFNRFYTRRIGVLQQGLLGSRFSLAEARVLWELAHRDRTTAAELGRDLGLDAGYLSRILRGFVRQGLLTKEASRHDGRQSHLSLTARGRRVFADLDERSQKELREVLDPIPAAKQARLLEAMQAIEEVLGGAPVEGKTSLLLRPPEPGDMGWVVHRHGALYAQEHGYGPEFEALVAAIVAKYVEHFDPAGERCWIAEKDGEVVGSVFLVRKSKTVAKLRLLLIEPQRPRAGPGGAARGRVRALRPAGGLPQDHALDAEPPRRRPPSLREGRLPSRRREGAPQLRPRPGGGDLGARPPAPRLPRRASPSLDGFPEYSRISGKR